LNNTDPNIMLSSIPAQGSPGQIQNRKPGSLGRKILGSGGTVQE
jgi:hypothetical protein